MKSSPKVSVITVVYRDLEGLKITFDSVRNQSCPIEWIVVDGDSGIDTTKFLKSLRSKQHTFKWISEKDSGLYDAMNKGYSLATGDIILFLNARDVLAEHDTISKVVKEFVRDEWFWAVYLAVRINESGDPTAVWEYLQPTLGGLALGTRTFCHQATFYTREMLDKVMPYALHTLAADHLLNIRCFKLNNPRIYPRVTTFFSDGGISSKRSLRASFADLRKLREQEKIVMFNSKLVDFVLTVGTVILLKVGGYTWGFLRRVASRVVQEKQIQ